MCSPKAPPTTPVKTSRCHVSLGPPRACMPQTNAQNMIPHVLNHRINHYSVMQHPFSPLALSHQNARFVGEHQTRVSRPSNIRHHTLIHSHPILNLTLDPALIICYHHLFIVSSQMDVIQTPNHPLPYRHASAPDESSLHPPYSPHNDQSFFTSMLT